MKKLFLALSFICHLSFAQTTAGHVVDANNDAIPNVNIYLDGTTFVTQSASDGSFFLDYKILSSKNLVISYIGYRTKIESNYNNATDLRIVLQKETINLDEVTINFDQFSRAQKLNFFKNEFLGKTVNGRSCTIENENILYFFYDKNARTLQAFADKPLIIINKNLGYKINVDLIGFEAKFYRTNLNPSEMYRCYFEVLSHFEEVSKSDVILRRRQKTYLGSQLHFFRNMSINEWTKRKFMLYVGNYAINPPDFFKITNDGFITTVEVKQDFKSFRKRTLPVFDIQYNKRKKSTVVFETNTFTIDIFGVNSHVEKIIFTGDLAERRVGSMLPIDYGIK